QRQILLKPGHYAIRWAVHEGDSRAASVLVDVDVPDPKKAPLAMGRIALASKAAVTLATGSLPALTALPSPPTALRSFIPGDTLAAFGWTSDADTGHAHTVDISTVVTNASGVDVFHVGGAHDAGELRLPTSGYMAIVPLTGWAPGDYVLTVTATRSSGGPGVS